MLHIVRVMRTSAFYTLPSWGDFPDPGLVEAAVQQLAGVQVPGDLHRGPVERRGRAQQPQPGAL